MRPGLRIPSRIHRRLHPPGDPRQRCGLRRHHVHRATQRLRRPQQVQVPPAPRAAASTAAWVAPVGRSRPATPDRRPSRDSRAPRRTQRCAARPGRRTAAPRPATPRHPLGGQRPSVAHRMPHRARRRRRPGSPRQGNADRRAAWRCGRRPTRQNPRSGSMRDRRGECRRAPAPAPPPRAAARRRRRRRTANPAPPTAPPRRPRHPGQAAPACPPPRARQHLQRDLGDHAQRAVAARQQLAQVEPGDVLQHPPAGVDRPRRGRSPRGRPSRGRASRPRRRGAGRTGWWRHPAHGLRCRPRRAAPTDPAVRRSGAGHARPAPPRSRAAACRRGPR